jgi:hypothetical protein
MTAIENNNVDATSEDHQGPREPFDGEIHLPATISKEFLSTALLWAIENEVEFGIFREPDKIVIAYFYGDEEFLPSRWSDRRWHIGEEDISDRFFPDDYA